METKEIMTRKEAAEYLNVSLSHFATFQNRIKQLRLGANVRFRKSDIDDFISENIEYHCKKCGKLLNDHIVYCENCLETKN